jgi:hypothetical protein
LFDALGPATPERHRARVRIEDDGNGYQPDWQAEFNRYYSMRIDALLRTF